MVVVVLCAHMLSCLGLRESCVSSFVGIKSGFFFVSLGFAPVFVAVVSWVCVCRCPFSLLVARSFCSLGCWMRSSRQTKTWSIEFLRSCKDLSTFEPLRFKLFWKMPKSYIFRLFVANLGTLDLRSECDVISLTNFRRLLKTRTPIFEYVRCRAFDSGRPQLKVKHFFSFLRLIFCRFCHIVQKIEVIWC